MRGPVSPLRPPVRNARSNIQSRNSMLDASSPVHALTAKKQLQSPTRTTTKVKRLKQSIEGIFLRRRNQHQQREQHQHRLQTRLNSSIQQNFCLHAQNHTARFYKMVAKIDKTQRTLSEIYPLQKHQQKQTTLQFCQNKIKRIGGQKKVFSLHLLPRFASPIKQIKRKQVFESANVTASHFQKSLSAEESEDAKEFRSLVEAFESIRGQMQRYEQSNHLSKQLEAIVDSNSDCEAIRKIIAQDREHFTDRKVRTFLRQYPCILSSLGYIVSIFKLKIAGERKKRFEDLERNIVVLRRDIDASREKVLSGACEMEHDRKSKRELLGWAAQTTHRCLALQQSYVHFRQRVEREEYWPAQTNTAKMRNFSCDVLRYETMHK